MKHLFLILPLVLLVVTTGFSQAAYYPLQVGKFWKYNITDYATSDTNRTNLSSMLEGEHQREVWSSSVVTYSVKKDSLVNGKRYFVITDSSPFPEIQLIREEDGNYFRLNSSFKEENFLKTGVKKDDVWIDYENSEQTVATLYWVISSEKTMTIQGKNYKNVIGIGSLTDTVDRLYSVLQSDRPFMPVKYYAQGVGLIYSYAPYPLGGTYSDLEVALTGSN